MRMKRAERLDSTGRLIESRLISLLTIVIVVIVNGIARALNYVPQMPPSNFWDPLTSGGVALAELITDPFSVILAIVELHRVAGMVPPPFMIEKA
ncbi:MAG: hypothetical protein LRS46_03975 [Desulfurococcales archaeon]|nr:hypothetical protein [Desulfurococcales archaeon]